jgi:putative restriction endonuclease
MLTTGYQDYEIGCIMLSHPIFLAEADRFPAPEWHPNIQAGRTYRLDEEPGLSLWAWLEALIRSDSARADRGFALHDSTHQRYGTPTFRQPRLGQASFQAAVLDAYGRRCAVTGEKVVPALEAAHIRAYGEGGEHRIDNGLLLRRDVHALFDRGYISITPDREVMVSRRLRTEFDNGAEYMALHGLQLRYPLHLDDAPNPEFLDWHNRNRFVA